MPPGCEFFYAGVVPPAGYLFCNGLTISRTTFAALFQALGAFVTGNTLTFQYDVRSTAYYALNPTSHWGVVTRADNHRNSADGNQGIWGAGMACGKLFLGPDPRCLLESATGKLYINEINTITVSAAEIARDLPDAIEQWRDTFGN